MIKILKYCILILLIVNSLKGFSQDVIMKRDGETIQAIVLDINDTQIKFKRYDHLDGPTRIITKSEVFYIKYENGKKDVFELVNNTNKTGVVEEFKQINKPGIILKRDGEEIDAYIIESTTNKIKYRKTNGLDSNSIVIEKNTVFYIKYSDGKKEVFEINESTKSDKTTYVGKLSFPKVSPVSNEDFQITQWNFLPGKFSNINKDFSVTGKYIYSYSGPRYEKSFNYLDYPATCLSSNNDLSHFNSIHVFYNEDNYGKSYLNIIPNGYSFRNDIYAVLKSKKAKEVAISNSFSKNDSLSRSLILQLKIDDINLMHYKEKKQDWPAYILFTLNVLGPDGKIVQEYKQVLFFDILILNHRIKVWTIDVDELYLLKKSKFSSDFTKATIGCAFNSLLSQFLNDLETRNKLMNFNETQRLLAQNKYMEINNLQLKLMNLRFKKAPIIDSLVLLGVQIDGINYTKLNINEIRATPSSNPYVSQQASYQTAQAFTAAGQLTGSIINMAEANKQRKIIEQKNRQVNGLKLQYQKLDIEERELSKSISSEILNSELVLLLPNNDQLNKSVESVLSDVKYKTKNAYARNIELNNAISKDLNNQSYQSSQSSQSFGNEGTSKVTGNTALTDAYNKNTVELNKLYNSVNPNNPIDIYSSTVNYNNLNGSGKNVSAESSAITNSGTGSGKDGNSPEGMACAKEAQLIYEGSQEYKDFWNNRNNINAPNLRYGELAKAKNAEVLLEHCRQYLNSQEQAYLENVSKSCRKNASEMNGNTIKFSK